MQLLELRSTFYCPQDSTEGKLKGPNFAADVGKVKRKRSQRRQKTSPADCGSFAFVLIHTPPLTLDPQISLSGGKDNQIGAVA